MESIVTRRRRQLAPERSAPRVGIFGFVGSGNLGNDAAFEVVLRYLRAEHPDASLDAMCMGPERLRTYYGVDAIPMLWYKKYEGKRSGAMAAALKIVGKGAAAIRVAAWVRATMWSSCPVPERSKRLFLFGRAGIPIRCSSCAARADYSGQRWRS